MVNKATIEQVVKINPHQLDGVMPVPNAAIHLFIEFDEEKSADQKKSIKKLGKILERSSTDWILADNLEDQQKIRKVRESVATILTEPSGQTKAVPVAEDIAVPVENLVDFLRQVNDIYTAAGMRPAVWGSAGDGVVRMHPMLDLSQTGDRQRLFKLADAVYAAALKLGGTVSASHGEGRVRAPYSLYMYGEQGMGLMRQIKKIFDPHNILNPGVKTASREEIKALLRGDYNQAHRHEHLPRS